MTRPRRVRFSDEQAENDAQTISAQVVGPLLVPSSEMSILEKRDMWWQPKEFDSFLEDAKLLASESRRRDTKEACGDQSYANVLWSVYKSCKETKAKGPSRKQRYKLSQWTHVAHTRRGLERICVRDMGVARSRQKQEVVRGVLLAQKRLKKNANPEEKAQLISMVSKTLTRPARLFAAVMGEADANAVIHTVTSDFPEKSWKKHYLSESFDENSPPKVLASLRMSVRILRRASSSRDSKRRRSCPSNVASLHSVI